MWATSAGHVLEYLAMEKQPMATVNLSDVLKIARQLPRRAQTELAETLLRESTDPFEGPPPSNGGLEPLSGMSRPELQALAESVLAPGRQGRLKALLRKNKEGRLVNKEQPELDALLEESDRIALLKAKALYTLQSLAAHSPTKSA